MQRKQQTIIVQRLMGKLGSETRIVRTLINTDRFMSANEDESGEFTWLRYEVESNGGGARGAFQNWKVLETLDELSLMTNALVEYEEEKLYPAEGNAQ